MLKIQEFPQFAQFATYAEYCARLTLVDLSTVATLELPSHSFMRCKVKMRLTPEGATVALARIGGAPRVRMACPDAPPCSLTALLRAQPLAGAPHLRWAPGAATARPAVMSGRVSLV